MQYSVEELVKLANTQKALIRDLESQLETATKLAEAAAEEAVEQRDLAERAGEVIADGVEKALESDSDTVSDETKDDIVEAVAKIDPDLASDLNDAFTKAEMQDEKITGEKMSSLIKHVVLDKLSVSRATYSDGLVKPKASDKTASRKGAGCNANAALEARYNDELNAFLGR